ncbi:DUF1707 domain-containing protein [Nocardioides sp. KIGAM211]|uniref:DUF1707 domain-containing protein n=1 Tax=Nocardioides luti TaxID=2761101 RepID=A0A7X0RFJ3_9ACTN|nr:DUF1707 domain-containing protein [Nocardioides luti]
MEDTGAWADFSHDPRDPAHAGLRAADRDRDAAQHLLTEAYADGRLDRAEFDTRSEQVAAARTLGELPPLLADLVAAPVRGSRLPARTSPAEIQAQAQRAYESDRREAFLGFLGPSLICLVIWLVISWGSFGSSFFWPGFVIAGTGINVVRTLVRRQDIVDEHVRRIEKKQAKDEAKELRARERPDADPAPRDDDGTAS